MKKDKRKEKKKEKIKKEHVTIHFSTSLFLPLDSRVQLIIEVKRMLEEVNRRAPQGRLKSNPQKKKIEEDEPVY